MISSTSAPIAAVRPAAGYIGGKKNLAGRIVPIIDRTPHAGYAEPFVGMGGIFLRRRRRPEREFINDVSGDVATFFACSRSIMPISSTCCGSGSRAAPSSSGCARSRPNG